MTNKAKLILIIGRPATGKSYVADLLGERLTIPVLRKDGIKETLFESLGMKDREWSMQLGRATFPILDYVLQEQLRVGNTIALESPLNPAFENEKFQKWQERYGFDALQIICNTDSDVLFERFKNRAGDGTRHAGHMDADSLEGFREAIEKSVGDQRMAIDSTLIELDTTDFEKVDYESLIDTVQAFLNK